MKQNQENHFPQIPCSQEKVMGRQKTTQQELSIKVLVYGCLFVTFFLD